MTVLRAQKELEAKIADLSVSELECFVSKFSFKNFGLKNIFFRYENENISIFQYFKMEIIIEGVLNRSKNVRNRFLTKLYIDLVIQFFCKLFSFSNNSRYKKKLHNTFFYNLFILFFFNQIPF